MQQRTALLRETADGASFWGEGVAFTVGEVAARIERGGTDGGDCRKD